ncbi:MAG: ABC transporter ATP-binding protein [Alphaproteobacteria bacterium]|nr:ABC transporter ATP-binding protein [Alphaproteobacteria bacterium]
MDGGAQQPVRGAPVRVQGVSKSFGALRVVHDVSLEVGAGEFVSLLGPSGSGKTTLLMAIAGFEGVDSGRISIGNRDVTDVPANRRDVALVFQKYALFPHMTVAENIAFPLRMRRIDRRDIATRVESALAMVRLDGYGARMPGQLSGGQQQRVALARAIVFNPPVLLMDEPLGALDKKLRQHMQLEIKRLQARLGATVIYVTHDQEEALAMSDRIAVLRDGRLEQVGTPAALYDRPTNAFVADFIGDTNLLPVTVLEARREECAVRLGAATVRATAGADSIRVGSAALLAIRPERLSVRAGDDGTVNGEVRAHVYLGAGTSLLIATRAGHELTARLPAGASLAGLQVGAQVALDWQAGDTVVLPPLDAPS